jgi:hypothetical protein
LFSRLKKKAKETFRKVKSIFKPKPKPAPKPTPKPFITTRPKPRPGIAPKPMPSRPSYTPAPKATVKVKTIPWKAPSKKKRGRAPMLIPAPTLTPTALVVAAPTVDVKKEVRFPSRRTGKALVKYPELKAAKVLDPRYLEIGHEVISPQMYKKKKKKVYDKSKKVVESVLGPTKLPALLGPPLATPLPGYPAWWGQYRFFGKVKKARPLDKFVKLEFGRVRKYRPRTGVAAAFDFGRVAGRTRRGRETIVRRVQEKPLPAPTVLDVDISSKIW